MTLHPGDHVEPVSQEVSRVDDDERHGLDKMRDTMVERSLQAAGRAEGAALVVSHQLDEMHRGYGGRIAVLEDASKTFKADVLEIKSDVKTLLSRSPYQQFLYALTALAVLAYMATLLWDRFVAGAG